MSFQSTKFSVLTKGTVVAKAICTFSGKPTLYDVKEGIRKRYVLNGFKEPAYRGSSESTVKLIDCKIPNMHLVDSQYTKVPEYLFLSLHKTNPTNLDEVKFVISPGSKVFDTSERFIKANGLTVDITSNDYVSITDSKGNEIDFAGLHISFVLEFGICNKPNTSKIANVVITGPAPNPDDDNKVTDVSITKH